MKTKLKPNDQPRESEKQKMTKQNIKCEVPLCNQKADNLFLDDLNVCESCYNEVKDE